MIMLASLILLSATVVVADNADRTVGCYTLQMSSWQPNGSHGPDDVYMTPPQSIMLTETPATDWDKNGLLVTPALGAKHSVHTSSYWKRNDDSIDIVWTTGFSGLTMTLHAQGNNLIGTANSFWDFGRPSQRSQVTANRVNCTTEK